MSGLGLSWEEKKKEEEEEREKKKISGCAKVFSYVICSPILMAEILLKNNFFALFMVT